MWRIGRGLPLRQSLDGLAVPGVRAKCLPHGGDRYACDAYTAAGLIPEAYLAAPQTPGLSAWPFPHQPLLNRYKTVSSGGTSGAPAGLADRDRIDSGRSSGTGRSSAARCATKGAAFIAGICGRRSRGAPKAGHARPPRHLRGASAPAGSEGSGSAIPGNVCYRPRRALRPGQLRWRAGIRSSRD